MYWVRAGGAKEVADDRDVRVEHFRVADRRAVDRRRAGTRVSSGRSGGLRGLRHRYRRRSGRRGALGGRKLRLERSETIAVLLLQRVEVFSKLIDLLPQRLR